MQVRVFAWLAVVAVTSVAFRRLLMVLLLLPVLLVILPLLVRIGLSRWLLRPLCRDVLLELVRILLLRMRLLRHLIYNTFVVYCVLLLLGRHGVAKLLQDFEPVKLTIFRLVSLVERFLDPVPLRIDRRESLKLLICLLVKLEALGHVVDDDLVQNVVLLLQQVVDQLHELLVLLLEQSKLHECRLPQFVNLLYVLWRL